MRAKNTEAQDWLWSTLWSDVKRIHLLEIGFYLGSIGQGLSDQQCMPLGLCIWLDSQWGGVAATLSANSIKKAAEYDACAACRRCDFHLPVQAYFSVIIRKLLALEIPKFMMRSSERSGFCRFENTWSAFLQVEVLDMEELGMEVARQWLLQRLTMAATCCRACLGGCLEDWSWRFSSLCRPCLSVESRVIIRRFWVFTEASWWFLLRLLTTREMTSSKSGPRRQDNSAWTASGVLDFQWREALHYSAAFWAVSPFILQAAKEPETDSFFDEAKAGQNGVNARCEKNKHGICRICCQCATARTSSMASTRIRLSEIAVCGCHYMYWHYIYIHSFTFVCNSM